MNNAFVLDGWLVVRFAWEHVMFQPEYVAAVLRGMIVILSGKPVGQALEPMPVRRPA